MVENQTDADENMKLVNPRQVADEIRINMNGKKAQEITLSPKQQ